MAEFRPLLRSVNDLGDRAPGLVWRLRTEDGDAAAARLFDDDRLIVNLTVREPNDHLSGLVYGGLHAEGMRGGERFKHVRDPSTVAWWLPAGTNPTVADAEDRLARYARRDPPRRHSA